MSLASKKPIGKILFLYNDFSGRQKSSSLKSKLKKLCQRHEKSYILKNSTNLNWSSLKKFLKKENINRIVIIGGDGALRFIMEKLYHNQIRADIGFIPCGSANIAARSLKLPLNFQRAFNKAINSPAHKIDIGIINNTHLFFIACVCGHLAKITTKTPRKTKKVLGGFGYIWNIAKLYGPYKKEKIKLSFNKEKLKKHSAHSLIICNHLNFHSLKPQRKIIHDDNRLDLFLIKNRTIFGLLDAVKYFYFSKIFQNRYFEHIRFSEVVIKNNKLYKNIHLDGDIIDITNEDIKIKVIHKHFNFIY